MKLNPDFIVHTIGEDTMLVPTGAAAFHGIAQGNKTVEVILGCLQEDTTEEAIVEALKARFDGDPAEMREDVAEVLSQLRSIGALDE